MAARTGAGTGVVVALVVFVLSTIFLLVLTVVFYSKQADAQEERDRAVAELDRFATRTQRSSDAYKAVLADATGNRDSAMQYLLGQKQAIMQKVLNDPNASIEQLQATLARYSQNANASYETVLRDLSGNARASEAEIQGLQAQIGELQNVISEKEALVASVQAANTEEVEAVRGMINQFMQDVQTYAVDVQEARSAMQQMVDELEQTFDNQVANLERELDTVRTDLALKTQQLAQVQTVLDQYRLNAQDPSRLVDGRIMDTTSDEQVFINRGRQDNVMLGMTFEVYDNESMLTPDQFGNIPQGKASLEVINVGDTTSTARVTRTSRGRPVVRGDVIANAVYDPNRTFMFLVHGKFDVDQDGRPSEAETQLVKNLIRDWGGEVVESDQVRGDMDFLLLGEQPTRPLPLRDNPSEGELNIWLQQMQAYDTYNKLLQDAMKADIPVLNQNRFFILIGHTPQ